MVSQEMSNQGPIVITHDFMCIIVILGIISLGEVTVDEVDDPIMSL